MNYTLRVVLADDHAVLRLGLKSFLEDQVNPRINVVGEASNGREAVALVLKLHPDLLLLDLSMQEMGGIEAAIELQRRCADTPILVLTQYDEIGFLRRVLDAGVRGYILKSARGDELLKAIQTVADGGTYIEPTLAGPLLEHRADPSATYSFEEAYERLTPRERQVLKLVAEGYTNKAIAAALSIAVKTVMTHRFNMMDKLGINNRSKLVQFAMHVGLLPAKY